jgi:2-(1,2-epoxy-1,2-dihydrophenyl)acetyl-CoA isomerase
MDEPIRTLVKRLYAALAAGDAAALEELLVPDFDGLLAEGLPLGIGGRHRGIEQMRERGWWAIGRAFRMRVEPSEWIACADGRLLVTGRYVGSARSTGALVDARFAHLWTARDERLAALWHLTDTAPWVAALAEAMNTDLRVAYTVADGVARIRLVRTAARNAIDMGMVVALGEAAQACANDPGVRAVLISAVGPAFTVGGDLSYLAGRTRDLEVALEEMIPDYHRTLAQLAALEVPVVCAVQGAIAGGGLGLAWIADIVLAADDSVFATGFTRLGLSGDGGSTWFLPRLVGLRRAQEMEIGGRILNAGEGLEWGLVTRVVPAAELEAEAEALVTRLAAGATVAFGQLRRLLRDSWGASLEQQLDAECTAIKLCARTADAREGISAFLERRSPRFTGRQERR